MLLGEAESLEALQINSEFGAGAEEIPQGQCRVGHDVAAFTFAAEALRRRTIGIVGAQGLVPLLRELKMHVDSL